MRAFNKQNVNLAQHISTGLVKLIDLSDCESQPVGQRLSFVYGQVSKILEAPCFQDGSRNDHRLVILDDLSTLEWIGFARLDILRFVRALRIACQKVCVYSTRVRGPDILTTDTSRLRALSSRVIISRLRMMSTKCTSNSCLH